MAAPLLPQREFFDIPGDVAYFNNASLAPLLKSARAAGEGALLRRSEPWRITTDDWFSDVQERRSLFAALLGTSADNIALVPATSYGLGSAARNLSAEFGKRVLIIGEDYPSNVYTWRAFPKRTGAELITAERQRGETWTDAVLALLDSSVAIVAVPNVHWTDGAILDLVAIGDTARPVGASLVIDASQSIGALPIDLAAVRPDYLVTVDYKWLLGPFGLGYLFVAPEHHGGEPLEQNWIVREGADDFARLVDYTDDYQVGARRFEVGERTFFEQTPVAVAALRQLSGWSVERIAATLGPLTARIGDEARTLGIEVDDPVDRGPHFLGLRLPDAVRERAPAMLKAAGVYVGMRGSAARVSPHLYTTPDAFAHTGRGVRLC